MTHGADQFPTDEVMKRMAKLAVEQATESLALLAERAADQPRMALMNGKQALTIFARAIRGRKDEAA